MANWLPQALRSGFTWNVAVMYLRWSEPYRPHCQWQDCDNGASIEIHWLANFWQFRPHRPVEEQTLKQVLMRCHYNASSMFLVYSCTEYFNFFCKEICELHFKAGGHYWKTEEVQNKICNAQLLWIHKRIAKPTVRSCRNIWPKMREALFQSWNFVKTSPRSWTLTGTFCQKSSNKKTTITMFF